MDAPETDEKRTCARCGAVRDDLRYIGSAGSGVAPPGYGLLGLPSGDGM